jgi:hypothetical protein
MNGFEDMLLFDMASADVVEPAVVGFPHNGVDRLHALIPREGEDVVDQSISGGGHAECVCQDDRSFKGAELLDLGRAGELAVRVGDTDRGGNLLLEDVPLMRNDRRHPGPDSAAFDHREVADLHAGNVGDGIERPGLERPGFDPKLPQARPLSR